MCLGKFGLGRLHKVLAVMGITLSVVGCEQPSTSPNESTHTTNPSYAPKTLSPKKSLAYGRESAIYRHLSRIWHLKTIDDIPISQQASIDLTQIAQGKATISLEPACTPISVIFNTQNIATGEVYVEAIERTLDECSDSFEDDLMAMIADTRRLERDDNDSRKLILISYQHKLTFTTEP